LAGGVVAESSTGNTMRRNTIKMISFLPKKI